MAEPLGPGLLAERRRGSGGSDLPYLLRQVGEEEPGGPGGLAEGSEPDRWPE